jgi:hypothetical protein
MLALNNPLRCDDGLAPIPRPRHGHERHGPAHAVAERREVRDAQSGEDGREYVFTGRG